MKLHNEDCIEQLQKMIDEGEQVDSIVTDPPYELGFMGKSWDSTGIAFQKETWELAFQLLKPGGHLLAFGGSRTYHRMAVAIEDAGFEIRDQIMWLYGSGFPKSLNIGKAVDKKLGNKRTSLGKYKTPDGGQELSTYNNWKDGEGQERRIPEVTKCNTEYEGWVTALKPAHEPVVMARKPVEGTVAENVLKHGTGGINIDGCRIGTEKRTYDIKGGENLNKLAREGKGDSEDAKGCGAYGIGAKQKSIGKTTVQGRFPANVMHDGSEEVLKGFPDSKGCQPHKITSNIEKHEGWGTITQKSGEMVGYEGEGSAARFFYCPKVSKNERNNGLGGFETKKMGMSGGAQSKGEGYDKGQGIGLNRVIERKNNHPTIKPVELMKYLCRLVTPKGGTVLDTFMGSGSTGMAAKDEGFAFIGIEKELDYYEIAEQRIKTAAPLLEFMQEE